MILNPGVLDLRHVSVMLWVPPTAPLLGTRYDIESLLETLKAT